MGGSGFRSNIFLDSPVPRVGTVASTEGSAFCGNLFRVTPARFTGSSTSETIGSVTTTGISDRISGRAAMVSQSETCRNGVGGVGGRAVTLTAGGSLRGPPALGNSSSLVIVSVFGRTKRDGTSTDSFLSRPKRDGGVSPGSAVTSPRLPKRDDGGGGTLSGRPTYGSRSGIVPSDTPRGNLPPGIGNPRAPCWSPRNRGDIPGSFGPPRSHGGTRRRKAGRSESG
mmetsp:Transcript_34272/g.67378  ORF Transcript_34272/g.67378 Transcript_34272/m.67378 type:complete len:226 (+) Transcript_34272:3260-3937(+)